MSDGGLFPWRVQKPRVPPICDYSKMTLPTPPPGKTWIQDIKTKEYKLVSILNTTPVSSLSQQQQQQQQQQQLQHRIVEEEASVHDASEADDWDLCSDDKQLHINNNVNSNSKQTTTQDDVLFVARAGSVRSINTLEGETSQQSSGPSFKMQRTHSSSTIDSNEQDLTSSLGPSGKGILGVDYLEHVILPTDTLQGICIAYKISTTRLRQANHFSGTSLLLAPKKLVIPISKKALKSGFIRVQDTDAKEYKLYSFLAEFHKNQFSMTEARAYLELADWSLKSAICSAREDIEWEREMDGTDAAPVVRQHQNNNNSSSYSKSKDKNLKSGEIRITAGNSKHTFQMQGAGAYGKQIAPAIVVSQQQQHENNNNNNNTNSDDGDCCVVDGSVCSRSSSNSGGAAVPVTPTTINTTTTNNNRTRGGGAVPYSAVPAISTKTVQPQDVYRAASTQDGNYGVELKDISSSFGSNSSKHS